MTKSIIFDFDGTIADSFDLFVATLQRLIKHPSTLTSQEIYKLRGMSIKQIMSKLDVKPWQIPKFILIGRREVGKHFNDVSIFNGMKDVVDELKANKHELYILSTNSKNVILNFIERYDLTDQFTQIYADIGLTGKSRVLKKLINEHGINPNDAVYIGDEIRDIEAAHKSNVDCLAVSWGYATEVALKAGKPEFLASNVKDITKLII